MKYLLNFTKDIIDYVGNEINIGDRVIFGKHKDICFGVVVDKKNSMINTDWFWLSIKTENTNVTIDRRSNQVIKFNT